MHFTPMLTELLAGALGCGFNGGCVSVPFVHIFEFVFFMRLVHGTWYIPGTRYIFAIDSILRIFCGMHVRGNLCVLEEKGEKGF